MSNIKHAGRDSLTEIGRRLRAIEERLLSPEQIEIFERLARHVNEIDPPPPVKILDGSTLANKISGNFKTASTILFCTETPPESASADFSAAQDGSVLGWLEGTTLKIAPKTAGPKMEIGNGLNLFMYCDALETVDFENVVFTASTFQGAFMDLYSLKTVKNFHLTEPFNAKNMFKYCEALKTVDGWTEETFALMTDNDGTFGECRQFDPAVKTYDFTRAGGIKNTFDNSGFTGEMVLTGEYSTLAVTLEYATQMTGFTFGGKLLDQAFINMSIRYCEALETLDLDKFDPLTAQVTSLGISLSGDRGLKTIYANGDWTTCPSSLYGTLGQATGVFTGCTGLTGYSTTKTGGAYCKPVSSGGYFTQKN